MATYRIGSAPAYRLGRVYEPGELIEIPDDEKPSKTWERIDGGGEPEKKTKEQTKAEKAAEKAAAEAAKKAAEQQGSTRDADKEPF